MDLNALLMQMTTALQDLQQGQINLNAGLNDINSRVSAQQNAPQPFPPAASQRFAQPPTQHSPAAETDSPMYSMAERSVQQLIKSKMIDTYQGKATVEATNMFLNQLERGFKLYHVNEWNWQLDFIMTVLKGDAATWMDNLSAKVHSYLEFKEQSKVAFARLGMKQWLDRCCVN
jgi:hypothetical protein